MATNILDFESALKAKLKGKLGAELETRLQHSRAVSGGIVHAELLEDLTSLTKTALRKKYPHEANSHKNRKHACTGTFAPEFHEFGHFLFWVGLCPHSGWTLDRVDNANPDYGPGLVRWASPKVQNANKGDTLEFVSLNGKTQSLKAWAAETGQKYNTLWDRLNKGWSPHEIIYGKAPKAAADSAELAWRDLLPEPYWPQWRWFEQNATANGNHLPPQLRGAGAEYILNLEQGPRGRALRLLCTASARLAELNEQLYEAQLAHDAYGLAAPDDKLSRAHDFWTAARARAWSVLLQCIG